MADDREGELSWRRERKVRQGLRLRDHLEAGPGGLRRKAKAEDKTPPNDEKSSETGDDGKDAPA